SQFILTWSFRIKRTEPLRRTGALTVAFARRDVGETQEAEVLNDVQPERGGCEELVLRRVGQHGGVVTAVHEADQQPGSRMESNASAPDVPLGHVTPGRRTDGWE
ncbi:unnamed protein product, partial [Ixodes persulcatus]